MLSELLDAAKAYCDANIKIVALKGKIPIDKGWREGKCSDWDHVLSQIISGNANGVGYLCGPLNGDTVSIDFDDAEAERWWVEEHRKAELDPDSYPTTITPRGKHRFVRDYRGTITNSRGKLKGLKIDPRGN